MQQHYFAFVGGKGKWMARDVFFGKIGELISGDEKAADSRRLFMPADRVQYFVGVSPLRGERKLTFEPQNQLPAFGAVVEDLEIEFGLSTENFRDLVRFLAGMFREQRIEAFQLLFEAGGSIFSLLNARLNA